MNCVNKEAIPLCELAHGETLHLTKFSIDSLNPGPDIYIQANVHGSENQGNAVIAYLIEHFRNHRFNGKIVFVPCANPLGINTKSGSFTQGRYHPADGDNYNRCYWDISPHIDWEQLSKVAKDSDDSALKQFFKKHLVELLERKVAEKSKYGLSFSQNLCAHLQRWAHRADIVLDLHCDSVSVEHLYSPQSTVESAKNFQFPAVYSIPEKFAGAMDEVSFMPWVALRAKLGRHHSFESYTLELGSAEVYDPENARIQATRVLYYLSTKGVLEAPKDVMFQKSRVKTLEKLQRYRAPCGGMLCFLKKPGSALVEGEVFAELHRFASDGKLEKTKIIALKNGVLMDCSPSSSILEGMSLAKVLED